MIDTTQHRPACSASRLPTVSLLMLILVLALGLAACAAADDGADDTADADTADSDDGGDDGDDGDEDDGEAEPISLELLELPGVAEPMIAYYTMADELGYFEEFNLDVEILHAAGGGPDKVRALLSGEADIATSDIVSVASAMNEGADISVVAGASSHYGATIVSRADRESVEDLRGQNFGVPSLGGTARIITDVALSEFDLLGEVEYLAVGGSPEMVPALDSGRIEAGTFVPSVLPLMQDDPDLNILVENTAEHHGRIPNFVYVATNDFIDENPEAIQRFVETMMSTHRDINDNFESYQTAIDGMLPGEYTEDELNFLWETITNGGYWAVNGGIHMESATGLLDLFYGLPDSPSDPDITEGAQLYNTEFVDAALDNLGEFETEFDEPDWR